MPTESNRQNAAAPQACNCPDCMLAIWTRDRELARRTAAQLRGTISFTRDAA